jgi:hypothetical protein
MAAGSSVFMTTDSVASNALDISMSSGGSTGSSLMAPVTSSGLLPVEAANIASDANSCIAAVTALASPAGLFGARPDGQLGFESSCCDCGNSTLPLLYVSLLMDHQCSAPVLAS